MKRRLLEHTLSVLLVGALFFAVYHWFVAGREEIARRTETSISPYLSIDSLDFTRPMHREMFREAVLEFYPSDPGRGDSLLSAIESYQLDQLTKREHKAGASIVMTMDDVRRLLFMFMKFVVLFLATFVLTTLGGRTIAVYRYVLIRQRRDAPFSRLVARLIGFPERFKGGRYVKSLLIAMAGGVAMFLAFSPAYVVAYAMKGRLEAGSILVLIPLAAMTNGVMMQYAARYLEQLVAAGQSGFVETALAKNLAHDWNWNTPSGLPRGILWKPLSTARGHVFHHIYLQAWYQNLPSLKEHASVLLTALIITEMAVNVQGHLGYLLLQNVLYRRYDMMATIMFLMFLTVKGIEVVTDLRVDRLHRRYANG